MSSKKLKAQLRVFKELENQLLIQAERLGIREEYSSMRMKEIEYAATRNHLLSFYSERANLEYEMQMLGTNKKDTLIKLERLHVYIRRAESMKEQYEKKMFEMTEKKDPVRGKKAKVMR